MTTTDTKVDLSDAKAMFAALERVVEERGADYVYEKQPDARPGWAGNFRCLYVHEGEDGTREPGCAIGLLVQQVTGTLDEFKSEGMSASLVLTNLRVTTGGYTLGAQIANEFQIKQDKGMPYGEALEHVRHVFATSLAD